MTKKPVVTTPELGKHVQIPDKKSNVWLAGTLSQHMSIFSIETKSRHLQQLLHILGLLGGWRGCSQPPSVLLGDLHSPLSSSEKLNLFISSVGAHSRAGDIVHVGGKSVFWKKNTYHWKNTFVLTLRYSSTLTPVCHVISLLFIWSKTETSRIFVNIYQLKRAIPWGVLAFDVLWV